MAARRPVWASTHPGFVRAENEDGCLVGAWRSKQPIETWRGELPLDGWAIVADGMGGHQAGKVASRVVLESIARDIPIARDAEALRAMLDHANHNLFEAMYNEGRPGMGTTVVGARFGDGDALVFNVGDSRAYKRLGRRLMQLSRDDSVGPSGPGRSARSHALIQSLGGSTRRTSPTPHIVRVQFASDDALLLCSDGLTDILSDAEIAGVWQRNEGNPAERLVAAAMDAGGRDNITVVVVGPEI